MPVIPIKYRQQRKQRAPFSYKQVSRIRQLAQTEINKRADKKQFSTTVQLGSLQNDTSYAFNLLSGIVQGDSSADRTGQEIYVQGVLLSVRMEKAAAVDRLTFRLRVYKENQDTFSNFNTFSSVAAANNDSIGLLTNNTDVTLTPNDRFSIETLSDKLYDCSNVAYSGADRQISHRIWIPIKKKMTYQTGDVFMKDHNLYCTLGLIGDGTGTVGGARIVSTIYFSE